MQDGGSTLAAILIILGLIVYIMPLAIAAHRDCKAASAIAVVNILLGWTFIGWVVSLAWALAGEKRLKAAPLPAGYRALTEEEKRLGVILLNGAQVTESKPNG